jgi:hypothetical protein
VFPLPLLPLPFPFPPPEDGDNETVPVVVCETASMRFVLLIRAPENGCRDQDWVQVEGDVPTNAIAFPLRILGRRIPYLSEA